MDCIIPGQNVKALARALQALAKIGDELFLEACPEKMSLLTFNMTKTVCGQFHLLDSYFSRYVLNESSLKEENKITCKIHMKIILPLFKGTHLEKKFDFVKIEYQPNSDLIIFRLKYRLDDIVMVHKLRLMDPEVLSISNTIVSTDNNICASSDFFNQLLSVFSSSDSDITFEITKDKVSIRNYYAGGPQRAKSVRSQVKLNASEFTVFRIKTETTINFSLKPLRTIIHFAECFSLNIGFDFEKGGRPLNITMKHPTFEVNFMVATLDPYSDAVSTIASASLPSKLTQIVKEKRLEITAEDIAAMENENWSDVEIETGNLRSSASSKKTDSSTSKKFIDLQMNEGTKEDEVINNKKRTSTNKGRKLFELDEINEKDDLESNNINKNQTNTNNGRKQFELDDTNSEIDDLLNSDSPRAKKTRFLFQRSLEPTFSRTMIEQDILAPNSDSE